MSEKSFRHAECNFFEQRRMRRIPEKDEKPFQSGAAFYSAAFALWAALALGIFA